MAQDLVDLIKKYQCSYVATDILAWLSILSAGTDFFIFIFFMLHYLQLFGRTDKCCLSLLELIQKYGIGID